MLEAESIEETITAIRSDVVNDVVSDFIPPQSVAEQWDVSGLEQHLTNEFSTEMPVQKWLDEDDHLDEEQLRVRIGDKLQTAYDEKCARVGDVMRDIERQIMLQIIDMLWKEHLSNMDHLRQGIGLRAYAQKNPKQEYKRESYEMFEGLLNSLKHEVVRVLFRVEPMTEEQMDVMERERVEALEQQTLELQHEQVAALGEELSQAAQQAEAAGEKPFVRAADKVGRNDPCPCGSGKKFKQCHGKLA